MQKSEDPGVFGVMKKHINFEILLVLAGTIFFCAFWIQYQMKSFVVTRDEGDLIKIRVSATEASIAAINLGIKEIQKDNESKMKEMRAELKQDILNSQTFLGNRLSEVTQRMIDRQDKYYEDLRDRIDGGYTRRRPPSR